MSSGFSLPLPETTDLQIPFFKEWNIPLGVAGFVALTYFVIVGTSNAVNLTDGADGLAIMPAALIDAQSRWAGDMNPRRFERSQLRGLANIRSGIEQ